MAYLLDTNVFIQAKNDYYSFNFCPAFWEWLVLANADKKVFSNQRIKAEIKDGEDELSEWADGLDNGFFLALPDMEDALKMVTQWVMEQDYKPPAVNTFFSKADYFLIAHALSDGFEVVTHEKIDNSKKKVKIPQVCQGLNIRWTSTYDMLQRENARFVLDKI